MKKFPKVGDVVVLRHDVEHMWDGCVFSAGKYVGARRHKETKVTKVYSNSRVAVTSGDVWDVVQLADGRWATGLKV